MKYPIFSERGHKLSRLLNINIIIMKKVVLVLSVLCGLLSTLSASSAVINRKNKGEEQYNQLVEKSLLKLNGAHDNVALNGVLNEFYRIKAIYPEQWLCDYYIAYMNLRMVFMTKGKVQQEALSEARKRIDNISREENIDRSEVETLDGYYYYALIASNPSVNGQKYYREVIESYHKAIAIDHTNPRPAFLLLLFQHQMGNFLGQKGSDTEGEFLRIEKLFQQFQPKEKNAPTWGKEEFEAFVSKQRVR
jgi:tetratricopeptide (TPR) repeat protein